MDEKRMEMDRYLQAISCLPPRLMGEAMRMPQELTLCAEEVRLRCGYPLTVVSGGREFQAEGGQVESAELRELLSRAARYSVHSYQEDLSRGFLPLEGGHRLGLCGTVARSNGEIVGYRVLSSVCIRVAREIQGAAEEVLGAVCDGTSCKSALIVAPPGLGKTTMLRDLIRRCSEQGIRVGIADERSELAALHNGKPQFDLGPCSDVIEGVDKSAAAMRLIRTMSPQCIAMDEITEERDLQTLQTAAHCGVSILATAHGTGKGELMRKHLFRQVFDSKMFDLLIVMKRVNGVRTVELEELIC